MYNILNLKNYQNIFVLLLYAKFLIQVHKYSFFLLLAVYLIGLFKKKGRETVLLIFLGLLLHYAGDLVANMLGYSILPLIALDLCIGVGFYLYASAQFVRLDIFRKFFLLIVGQWVFINLTTKFIVDIFIPQESIVIWVYTQVCTAAVIGVLHFVFRKKDFSFKR